MTILKEPIFSAIPLKISEASFLLKTIFNLQIISNPIFSLTCYVFLIRIPAFTGITEGEAKVFKGGKAGKPLEADLIC
jgi:hypothetical protein